MSRRGAVKLIEEHEGHLCVRFYRRKDGTILTQDCLVGVKKAEHTFLKIVGRVFVWPLDAILSIPAIQNRLPLMHYLGGSESLYPPDLADIWRERYPTEEAEIDAVRKQVDEGVRKRNNT